MGADIGFSPEGLKTTHLIQPYSKPYEKVKLSVLKKDTMHRPIILRFFSNEIASQDIKEDVVAFLRVDTSYSP